MKVKNFVAFVALFLIAFGSGLSSAEETVPIGPCRILDTRRPPIGYLLANTQLDFSVRAQPSSPSTNQGGEAGCSIPHDATGVFLNIIATQPSSVGNGRIWAYGAPIPNTSVINVSPLLTTESTATVLVKLGTTGSAYDISIKNEGFATHWVVDIYGYTEPSLSTLVGQALGVINGDTLLVESPSGLDVKVFASSNRPLFYASFVALIPSLVGRCVHVDGVWYHDTVSTAGFNTVEARGLPTGVVGQCGAM